MTLQKLFFKERNMYIDWQLSDWCNFNCTYCNVDSMGRQYGWPDNIAQATNLIDSVLKFSTHEYRTWNLLGGEPVLWRYFGDLCTYIKDNDPNSIIQVLTNGSRTLQWWERFAPLMNKIIISHHATDSDPNHVIEVVNACQPYASVSVQVLMDVDNFNQCVTHFNQLVAALPGVKISAKKGETNLGSGTWMDYTQDQLQWLNDSIAITNKNDLLSPAQERLSNYTTTWERTLFATRNNIDEVTSNKELVINNENHFNNWQCNIGLDMISIKPNGNIKPASSCFKEVVISNYKQATYINWPTTPMTCTYDSCFCGADIEVEKHAPE